MLQRFSYLSIFVLLSSLLLLDYGWLNFTAVIDDRGGDWVLEKTASQRAASPDIVIIDIDQKSLEVMNEVAGSWPWPRAIHAELLTAIAAHQPKAIVFDVLFNEADSFRADSDQLFRDTVKQQHNIYLPSTLLVDGVGAKLIDLPAIYGLQKTKQAKLDARAPLLLPLVLPPETWRGGLINFKKDDDGIGRYYWMYIETAGWRIPSMPQRLAADLAWPKPSGTDIRLNWSKMHRHISYSDLYLDFNREKPQRPADELRDKIIIIGTAAPGLQDLRPTPVSANFPGVEILATAIDNLQHGDWLQTPDRGKFAPLGLLLMALLLLGFQRKVNTLYLGGGLMLLTLAGLALFWLGLSRNQYWSITAAITWAWVYYWLAALFAYLAEKAQREQAISLFGRFLDQRVVKQLVAEGEINTSQQAESRQLTILFSDIRGFTTLSETRSPEYIVSLLNRYFSQQVEIIFRHGGTLDKFIGDAIMAFWGAPVNDSEHAKHAVAAAIEMSAALVKFKTELTDLGADFDIGIGLHTGPAVVGFIGSNARLDYTIIGDSVNLASRIEGLTKGISRVLVSDATRLACGEQFVFVPHGSFHVKGREQEVELFEPLEIRKAP
ncbi:adenylate/guanylate cyclase domain-containing protein [Iodobacter sp. CM08]|uniref:adenylate/guanylate cyclase domain-containing protein n=1 Tax=Iodobacter sp. CM08 TaxID=3085902 RepID=UPI0029826694|nr:adenylate/guanylate cyclase domain-containing protein [Iodobacter sp. CM08]MDW5417766.1 adenylate/guanylate cyclase domain-containing protein [Iodobacter sp. CM08]